MFTPELILHANQVISKIKIIDIYVHKRERKNVHPQNINTVNMYHNPEIKNKLRRKVY